MGEFVFPQGFFWGAATSSHQVEGDNTNNDWWAWEQAGRVKEHSGIACDHYRRFREDFDLAAQLGHTAHRLSIEWSRVEPHEGVFDETALAHYRDVMQALRQRHLEPIVTLHHFTNPLWLAKAGGWTNPKVVEWFARYARRVAEVLGRDVRYWLTINEPQVYAIMHYLDGTGPPGERNAALMFRVWEHLIRGHAAAYHVIHEATKTAGWPTQVSLADHMQMFVPCRKWWLGDRIIARLTERTYNQRFLDAITEGIWRLPGRRPIKIPDARHTLDYLGMNYYNRHFMRLIPSDGWWGVRCDPAHHREVTERNFLGWEVYPPGMLHVLRWTAPYRLPVLITENGICAQDDWQRERFIVNHLTFVARAIQEGVSMMGYLYWSLIDNFEWAQGYAPRFGLIEVDYPTQARRVRPSAKAFEQICRTNRLVEDGRP